MGALRQAATPSPGEDVDGRTARRVARSLLDEGRPLDARRWATAVADLTDDLGTWSSAATVLGACLADAPLPRSARVAVLGSSTTSQLAALLPLACARASVQVELYEAPYGQLRQQVLDPASALHEFGPDIVVVATSEHDVDLPALSADPQAALDAAMADLRVVWDALARHLPSAVVLQFTVAVPPDQPFGDLTLSLPGSRSRLLQMLNLRLGDERPDTVVLVDCAALASRLGADEWFDHRYWHLARQSVGPRCIAPLARQVGAVIGGVLGTSRKCLVLDLDNTLWGGVLGEDGVDGIQLGEGPEGEAFAAFQHQVLALKQRGVVLAVCSKNDEPLVRDAFDRHPGMCLALDDIAVLSAGWDDKPAQLRRIAADLGLGLDALVLVDDNPFERESVRQMVPDVDVIRLPPDPAGYVRALTDYPYFAAIRLTQDDLDRAEQYRARAEAAAAQAGASSLEGFLDSLEMEARVEPVGPANLGRVAQLVAKTNQFNLTGHRRSEAELAELIARPGTVAVAARLRDRFADHGLVAVVIAEQEGPTLEIDTWLMSCRVIGRTLEAALLGVVADAAAELGCTRLRGAYRPTAKNGLVAELYPSLGFVADGEDADGTSHWTVDLDDLGPVSSPHVPVVETGPMKERT